MSLAVSDAVSKVLSAALDGVSLRQSVVADNIANVDTPGYTASSVDFETSLRRSIDGGDFAEGGPVDLQVEASATTTPAGPNGNNVDLRKETLAAVQSQFQYQMLARAVTDRHSVLRDSLASS